MPFSASDTAVSALKLFVWGAKLGTLGGWVEIATSAGDLIGNVKALDKAIGEMGLTALTKALDDIRADADRALRAGHGMSPHKVADARAIFDQTALKAFPSSARLVELGLDPDRVLAEMLATAKLDRDFRETAMAESYFTLVLGPVLKRLLNDAGYLAKLGPDFQRRVLADGSESLDAHRTTHAELAEIKALVERLTPRAEAEGVPAATVIALAQRISPAVADRDTALRELERAVDVAANVIAEGPRGSNIDTIVDKVLKRLATLTAQGRLPDARAVAAQALAEAREGAEMARARHLRLLDAMIEQDTLARDAQAVCDRLVEKVALEHPDPATRFEAMESVWHEWYNYGLDKGLAFDLSVSVELAGYSIRIAKDSDQRGIALKSLGNSLVAIGNGKANTAQLKQAIANYHLALAELTRERMPSKWAEIQMDIGIAQAMIAERESSFERFCASIDAYGLALEVVERDDQPLEWAKLQLNIGCTLLSLSTQFPGPRLILGAESAIRGALTVWSRSLAPSDWARAQMNLGLMLQRRGERDSNTEVLDEAVGACQAALAELDRDKLPREWALAQMYLGNSLASLAALETSASKLVGAKNSYCKALEETTRERSPLDWANLQGNLGNVEIALFDKTGDLVHLDLAEAYIHSAREVFSEVNAAHYLATANRQLELVNSRRAQ